MFAGQAGHGFIRAERAADAAHLVRADGNADARAAYDDAARIFAIRHGFSHGESHIGIIHAFFIRAAEILHLEAKLFDDGNKLHFKGVTAVIRSDCDLHFISPSLRGIHSESTWKPAARSRRFM